MRATKLNTRNNDGHERNTPNKFDLNKKRREGTLVYFVDSERRSYGLLSPEHKLHRAWTESGAINNTDSFAMWVALPKIHQTSESEQVEFPRLNEQVELWTSDTNTYVGAYTPISYPEHITRKSRTTSVIMLR